MSSLLLTLAACTFFATASPAQTASYTVFGGPGCDPFVPSGVPRLGATFTITTYGTYIGISRFLFTGVSNTQWGSLGLPFTMPGMCGSLLVSGELIQPMPFCSNGHLHRGLTFGVPNDPSLLGAVLYQQGVAIVNGQVRTTQAGRAVIGT